MQDNSRNIYYNARHAAGLTQERWAETLGLSVETVRQYETDRIMPSAEVVQTMAEVAMLPALCYWHLCRKSKLARDVLPEVERLPLPQAVVQLLAGIRSFENKHRDDNLLEIAADGRVDQLEGVLFRQILDELETIVRAAIQLRYAEEDER